MAKANIVINKKEGKSTAQHWGNGIDDKSTTIVNVFVITSTDPDECWEKIMKQVSKQKGSGISPIIIK